jgi:hypothetical protein
MIEAPSLRPGKKRQGDDAHCFLRIVAAVGMGHPGSAKNLQLAEDRMDRTGGKAMEERKKCEHHQSAEEKSNQRRCNHRNNHFWPESAVPFQHRRVSPRGRERGSTQAANQRMTGTRRESDPPGRNIPGEGSDERAQHIAARTTTKNVIIGKNRLRVFQDDLQNNVPGVAAAIDYFFE